MEVNRLPIFQINNDNKSQKQNIRFGVSCPNLAPLKQDTVSFKGTVLKKSDFNGTDLAVIEKYKPNIQQFKSKDDLQKFAECKIKELFINPKKAQNGKTLKQVQGEDLKDFGGRQEETKIQRKAMLKEWFDYVTKENNAYSNTQRLIILSAMTKGLDVDNDTLPPVLNKGLLADTIAELEERLRANPNDNFDFNKMYKNKLRNYYLEDTNTGETNTKWVVIPSKKHDSKNFEKNVEKLKTLSHKNWCTRSFNAEPYLTEGDFHVYLENGQPKLGVRFKGSKIQEIQGEENNSIIPQKYFDIAMEHINDENLKLKSNAKNQIKNSEKLYTQITQIKKDLETAIKENDVAKILKYGGMKVEEDEDGFLHLEKYKCYLDETKAICFDDIGIDENKLFEKIKEVDNAIFIDRSSNIQSFGALEKAGIIHIDPSNHKIIKAPNLKQLRNLSISNDHEKQRSELLKNLEVANGLKIKEIRNNIKEELAKDDFNAKKIFELFGIKTKEDKDGFLTISAYYQPSPYNSFEIFGIDENKLLEKVKRIEGNAYISPGSRLKSLGNVEQIGGQLTIDNELADLGKLKHVGDLTIYDRAKIKSLGSLESIEKSLLIVNNENIKSLGELKSVGGSLYITHSPNIASLGNLKSVGANLYLTNSNISDLGALESVGGLLDITHSPNITSLGKLKSVGTDLILTNSNVSDLGALEYIGNNAWFNKTKIKDLSRLKHIGEYLLHRDSKIKYSDYKHITRNHNPLFYLWHKIWYYPLDKD